MMAMAIAACEVEKDFFSAPDLYQSMLRTSFEGVTGQVEFDNATGTRYLSQVRYSIFNTFSFLDPEDVTGQKIIFRSTESAIINLTPLGSDVEIVKPFLYADNTTERPLFLPLQKVDVNLIPRWALGLGLSLCGVMMVMSIAWGIWTFVNRKQRVVRVSQPFFLSMLCIGTFMIASSIIPTSFQEPMSTVSCARVVVSFRSLTIFI